MVTNLRSDNFGINGWRYKGYTGVWVKWAMVTLANAKQINPDMLTKSGMMLGLGETWAEVTAVMQDLADRKVDILTLGQYLQPNKMQHLPVSRYYPPAEFAELRKIGLDMGFQWVEAGPLVRSSYHAEQ